MLVNAILIVQPTFTPEQKRKGAVVHGFLNGIAMLFFLSAFAIILYNKSLHTPHHFTSAHGRLGLITYILAFLNACTGVTSFAFPQIYGGEERAKSLYKYHRVLGYIVLLFGAVTAILGTQNIWMTSKIDSLALWVVLWVVILISITARVRLNKMKIF